MIVIVVYLISNVLVCNTIAEDINKIPDGFLIGAATAAYQIEGGWNEDGKGESIWDHLVHTNPKSVLNGANGDISADSYHRYSNDIKALEEIGMQHYRFSISWPRILPTGDITNINQKGIDYYNALIDEVLENNIQPLVTMYHWDLPQALQDLGGWANPVLVDYFEDYARLLYKEFGDRVKTWITINEPVSIVIGYGFAANDISSPPAPAVNASDVGGYLAAHTLIKAHARAYHVYDMEFREEQQGKVSITLSSVYMFPKTDSEDDRMAAESAIELTFGWFAHPIFSKEGDYPAFMKEYIGNQSKAEGRYRSKLPEFDDYWVDYIKGSYDFLGLNHYSSFLVSSSPNSSSTYGVELSVDPNWPTGDNRGVYSVPEGMRKMLNWVSNHYDNPDVFITENGWQDAGGTNDTMRIEYINGYMAEVLKAIHLDNCSVIGYTIWSIIDNFEWNSGYTVKFGLYKVDFEDPKRPRTPKESAKAVSLITSTRQISEEYFQDVL